MATEISEAAGEWLPGGLGPCNVHSCNGYLGGRVTRFR